MVHSISDGVVQLYQVSNGNMVFPYKKIPVIVSHNCSKHYKFFVYNKGQGLIRAYSLDCTTTTDAKMRLHVPESLVIHT